MRWMHCLFTSVASAALLTLPACVTEFQEGQEPLPPRPRDIPAQPASLVVNRITFSPTLYAGDVNGNGKGDRLDSTVYLWSQPYPFPIHSDGTLTIHLYRPGEYSDPQSQPLREWVFAPEQLRAARASAQPGPCYFIELSLLDAAHRSGDDLDVDSADLVATFEAPGKAPITSGLSTVHLDNPGR